MRERKLKGVTVRLTKAELDKLDLLAQAIRRTRSGVVRELLCAAIDPPVEVQKHAHEPQK